MSVRNIFFRSEKENRIFDEDLCSSKIAFHIS